MNEATKNTISNFLESLDLDILDYIDLEEIDLEDPFNDIYKKMEDSDAFYAEVIYYTNAIKYLAEYDPSLKRSLKLASDFGYTVDDLDSEILASILAPEVRREKLWEKKQDIENFFKSLEIEEEDESEDN